MGYAIRGYTPTSLPALKVSGAATLGSTLAVTGASTLASVAVTGAATVGTTLAVTGDATLATATSDNGPVRTLPETTAQVKAAMGLTGTVAFYRFDWLNTGSATSLGDLAGTLTAAGSPVYNKLVSGKPGVHFAANTDAFAADVHDFAATSFGFAIRGALVSDPAGTQHGLVGRADAGFACGWNLYFNDAGDLLYYFNGAGAGAADAGTLISGICAVGGQPFDLVGQLDYSSTVVFRARWSRNGVNIGSTSVTLTAAVGSMSGAGQTFGVGDYHAGLLNGEGAWVNFLAIASGTQVEGAAWPLVASQGLGFEP